MVQVMFVYFRVHRWLGQRKATSGTRTEYDYIRETGLQRDGRRIKLDGQCVQRGTGPAFSGFSGFRAPLKDRSDAITSTAQLILSRKQTFNGRTVDFEFLSFVRVAREDSQHPFHVALGKLKNAVAFVERAPVAPVQGTAEEHRPRGVGVEDEG
jgi:hypothetical protein